MSGVVFPEPEYAPAPGQDWLPFVIPGYGGGEGEGPRLIPSFMERLEALAHSDVDLTSSRAASLVPEGDAMSFLMRHGLEPEAQGAISARRSSFTAEVQRGLLGRLWDTLRNVVIVHRTTDTDVRVPIAELHVPRVAQCQSKYVAQHSTSDHVSFKIAARGIGAGGGMVKTVVATQTVEASDECLIITVPVDIQKSTYDVPPLGRSIEIVGVKRVYTDVGTIKFTPPFTDPCAADYAALAPAFDARHKSGELVRNVDFDKHPVGAGLVGKAREVRRERHFLMSVPNLLEVETRFTASVSYEFKLAAGHDYLGYYEERDSAKYYWAW